MCKYNEFLFLFLATNNWPGSQHSNLGCFYFMNHVICDITYFVTFLLMISKCSICYTLNVINKLVLYLHLFFIL